MRFFLLFFITILSQIVFAQEEITPEEEKVFSVVEEMPRFPGCEDIILSKEERKKCAEDNMLRFIYHHIRYPDSARINGTEGRAIIQFNVSEKGMVDNATLVRDIGHGCGEEALRVVNLMKEENIIWKPGIQEGKPVKVKFTLPIAFKLQEELPYTIFKGDTIYLKLSTPVQFKGGDDALKAFLATEVDYPSRAIDSCWVGTVKTDLLIHKDGTPTLLETLDYSNLGNDFLFEIIKLIPKTNDKWTPATYDEKPVTTYSSLRIDFKPTNEKCKSIVTNYELAEQKANEGVTLHDEGNSAEGLLKINEAIEAFPNNTEWLYFRGIMNFTLKENEKACEDFQKIRDIAGVAWYEKWIDTICGF